MALLDAYITREELAKELGVTTRTLDKYAENQIGPHKFKIGARCFYVKDDVLAWVADGAARGATVRQWIKQAA